MRQGLLLCVAFYATASAGRADIVYQFSVDTSSIAGTSGSLDLQFNPGPLLSQPALLQILNFTSDGTLAGSPTLSGDVSGELPATLTLDNGSFFNDYFEGFTFGSNLLFDVRLYGPAVNSPDGTSTSGSTFAFSMFSDPGGSIPALTSDLTNGFAATVDVNLAGTPTVNQLSTVTDVSPLVATPEPNFLALIATIILVMIALRECNRRGFRGLAGRGSDRK